MLGFIWRFFCSMFDVRALARLIWGRPLFDVAFITNMRDETDLRRFLGNHRPSCGHFSGPRVRIRGIAGRTRALVVTASALSRAHPDYTNNIDAAKRMFRAAAMWAKKRGARAVLLAGSTKHLFDGDEGGKASSLKEAFPDTLFTIGDNGTSLLLLRDCLRAVLSAGLGRDSRIAVIGPDGLIGSLVIKELHKQGYRKIIGVHPEAGLRRLEGIRSRYRIEACHELHQMGQVDAIVACTHREELRLKADLIVGEGIRKRGRKLLVVDVSEPHNFSRTEYEKCKEYAVRIDGGNAWSPHLKYVLGALSYRLLRHSKGVIFGCFAETMALSWAMKKGDWNICGKDLRNQDWLEVSESNMKIIAELFRKVGFDIPPRPLCFGKPIDRISLDLPGAAEPATAETRTGVTAAEALGTAQSIAQM